MKKITVVIVIFVLVGWMGFSVPWAAEENFGAERDKARAGLSQLATRNLLEQEQDDFIIGFKKRREKIPGVKTSKLDVLLDQAVELFAQRDFIKAEDKLKEVLRSDQGNVEALNWLSRIRLAQGYDQEALEIVHKTLFLDSKNIDALNGEAVIYMRQQMFDKVLTPLNRALKVDPKSYRTLSNLGAFYFQVGKINQAILYLNQAIEIAPKDTSAYFNLSIVYWKLGELREAERLLEKVLEYEPKNLRAHYLLSTLDLQVMNYSDFISHQQVIVKLRPKYADKIFLNIAQAYALNKRVDDAIEYGKKSLRINSKNFDAHFLVGYFYREKGERKQTINHWKEALDLEGNRDLKEAIRDYIHHNEEPKITF